MDLNRNGKKLKKNPILVAGRAASAWRALRSYPGVFTLQDALSRCRWLLQPDRFTEREMCKFIQDQLRIKTLPEGVHEVEIRDNGLFFYWLGDTTGGLASGVLQEIDPTHPHYYTSPPVQLTPSSVVLDVGACDGLFAFRVARQREAARVICFEPGARTARFLEQAAHKNGVADRIQIEVLAVGSDSRDVFFTDLTSPEGNHVVEHAGAGLTKVRQVSIDDYCREHGIRLSCRDLVKVDAEGADVDVIRGAEENIRAGAPQIAVTTYHDPAHAAMLIEFLHSVQPRYQLRLKGLTLHNTKSLPRPVLLQAAVPPEEH
jgi:FkbM family methyltransferase